MQGSHTVRGHIMEVHGHKMFLDKDFVQENNTAPNLTQKYPISVAEK